MLTAPLRQPLLAMACAVPLLLGIYAFDECITQGRTIGNRRAYHAHFEERLAARPKAAHAIMGQSTMGQWLGGGTLAGVLGVDSAAVVDAHIGGCHPGCSFAQTRKMLAEGRHYDSIFFGVNLYTLCEDPMSWRVLSHTELLPLGDWPELMRMYLSAEQPLTYYGRVLGMQASGAYADTAAVRKVLRAEFSKHHPDKWVREPHREIWIPSCAFTPEDTALKVAFVRALLPDLEAMADRVYYLMLPDRTTGMPEHAESWERFMALHAELALEYPHITFIDLIEGGVTAPDYYRDGVHLNSEGIEAQTRLLVRRLKDLERAPQ